MCLYPKLIYNRKYTANKKNGGVKPPLPLVKVGNIWKEDLRVTMVPVGCGNCMECMKKRAREWQVRLQEDIKWNKNGVFVTLTFSNESILELSQDMNVSGYNRDNEIAKKGVRRFLERWRKKNKKSVRHWLVTELGHSGTENIHLHGIIWTDKPEEIAERWRYGYCWLSTDNKGYVNEATVNYIVKYIYKADFRHKFYKPRILTSNGIGSGYVGSVNFNKNSFKGNETKEVYVSREGVKFALPIYYRNKIYSDEEREKLWIAKLDEGVRWVDGLKIDVSESEEYYYRALEEARIKSKSLGFTDDAVNWELKRYENARRNLNFMKRVQKAFVVGGKKGKAAC